MAEHLSLTLPVSGKRWQGVRYGSTTRVGGVSAGSWAGLNLGMHTGDEPESVRENRRRLASSLPAEPLWLQQVHGIDVADADADIVGAEAGDTAAPGDETGAQGGELTPVCADAAVTTRPGRVLAVLTADCAPVVIAETQGRALGVAHAGWRGLAAGVLEATLAKLRARVPGAPSWRAWVGPCIGQAAFEVGDVVRYAFIAHDPQAGEYFVPGRAVGKWQADLAGLARQRLHSAGVEDVEIAGLCTFARADSFYSYRRDSVTGRIATLAWLDPQYDAF